MPPSMDSAKRRTVVGSSRLRIDFRKLVGYSEWLTGIPTPAISYAEIGRHDVKGGAERAGIQRLVEPLRHGIW